MTVPGPASARAVTTNRNFKFARMIPLAIATGAILLAMPSPAWSPSAGISVVEAAETLKPGEYLWAPDVAPHGPLLLMVSLTTQRATLYRNGVPIAISTVSTGKPGHRTPTGVFTILQRKVEHYSSIYDDAPMPYMQRLTWGGIALHGGTLPGYPASHGCIRLPHEFARRLYGVTRLGMTVVVTDAAALPRIAPGGAVQWDSELRAPGAFEWHPERATAGPVSAVISVADERVVVLRNGVAIGTAPVRIDGKVAGTSVFVRQGAADQSPPWVRVDLPDQIAAPLADSLAGRIHVDPRFRALVEPLLEPGTSIVVTADSLRTRTPDLPFRIEGDTPNPEPD